MTRYVIVVNDPKEDIDARTDEIQLLFEDYHGVVVESITEAPSEEAGNQEGGHA